MFVKNEKDLSLEYISTSGRRYSLLQGYTNNMLKSGVIFIFDYGTEEDEYKTKNVDYLFGDLQDDYTKEAIEQIIEKYEAEMEC